MRNFRPPLFSCTQFTIVTEAVGGCREVNPIFDFSQSCSNPDSQDSVASQKHLLVPSREVTVVNDQNVHRFRGDFWRWVGPSSKMVISLTGFFLTIPPKNAFFVDTPERTNFSCGSAPAMFNRLGRKKACANVKAVTAGRLHRRA